MVSLDFPQQYNAQVNSAFMPQVQAQFDTTSSLQFYLIDNQANVNTLWSQTCVQSNGQPCSDATTFVTTSFLESQISTSSPFSNLTNGGGYLTSGNSGSIDWAITPIVTATNPTPTTITTTSTVYSVDTINQNAWLYNVPNLPSGQLGFGLTSDFIASQLDTIENAATWMIEIGQVADQSFSGYTYNNTNTSNLYIGPGNYALAGFQDDPTITTAFNNTNGSYNLYDFQFGYSQLNSTLGYNQTYYQQLGYQGYPQLVDIQLNFQGLGLPQYFYQQFLNLLFAIPDVGSDLTCTQQSCSLPNSCESYPSLWYYNFMLQLNQTDGQYVTVPLSSFAIDGVSSCQIYVQYLSSSNIQSNSVILGSMFLQNFLALFVNDYNTSTQSLALQVSKYSLPGAFIGSTQPSSNTQSPFILVTSILPQVFNLEISNSFEATIKANLGYQGFQNFMVSVVQSPILSWSTNCTSTLTTNNFCDTAPVYAQPYFNLTGQNIGQTSPTLFFDGFQISGFQLNQAVCLDSLNVTSFCTINSTNFYVADTINVDNWNKGVSSQNGIVGFGLTSPIWSILGQTNANQILQVQLSNFTNYSFVNQTYTPITTDNQITIGALDISLYQNQENIVIKSLTAKGKTFQTTQFGFGISNQTNNSESFTSINNDDEDLYGVNTNTVRIDLDFRGLGLPTTSYNKFQNLLSIVTQKSGNCLNQIGGYCTLPGQCSNYQNLWNFSFKIQFSSNTNYLVVPLASFAADQNINDNDYCAIYVEYLDATQTGQDTSYIILGSMFFQSVFYLQQQQTYSYLSVTLYQNVNSLQGLTYLGSAVRDVGQNPFEITPLVLPQSVLQPLYGVPSFYGSLLGFGNLTTVFYVDFTSDTTIVWDQNCTQSLITVDANCTAAPTYAVSEYQHILYPVSGIQTYITGGFSVTGIPYADEICLNSGQLCSSIEVVSVSNISADTWLYNQTAENGILGLAPNSPVWGAFIDPNTGVASYSISLSGTGVTLGSSNTSNYVNSSNITLQTQNISLYGLQSFGFGTIYTTVSGIPTSSYFANYTTQIAQFNLNFQGLGLPDTDFNLFVQELQYITNNDATCSATIGGSCVLAQDCSSYNNLFSLYQFQIVFTGASSQQLIIPLSAFVQSVNSQCQIQVQYLDSTTLDGKNIILGGLFFKQFYGVFTNSYDSISNQANQTTVQLFVDKSATISGCQINQQQLQLGVNPFNPVPMSYSVVVNNLMPEINVVFVIGDSASKGYLIDNMAQFTVAWTDDCTQTQQLATNQTQLSCQFSPSNVNDTFDQTQLLSSQTYSSTNSGGYTTSGLVAQGLLTQISSISTTDNPQTYISSAKVSTHAANNISANAWLYNAGNQPSGQLALGSTSPFLKAQYDSINNLTQWMIVMGNVADQSFSSSSYVYQANSQELYIGAGNYQLVGFNSNVTNETLYLNTNNSYTLNGAWIGSNSLNSTGDYVAYYQPLGWINSLTYAYIQTNYQGLGLPSYDYFELVNLLYRTSQNVAQNLYCPNQQGSICTLNNTCENYPELWNLTFKLKFEEASSQYVNFPLSSLATQSSDGLQCQLYIQQLFADQPMSDRPVLGTMFLQNFNALFTYDISGVENQGTLTIQMNQYSLNGASIDKNGGDVQTGVSPFLYIASPQIIQLFTNSSTIIPVASANLGYQGYSNFSVSVTGNSILAWSTNCQTSHGIGAKNCSQLPYNANEYYNTNSQISQNQTSVQLSYNGFNTEGYYYNQAVCLGSETVDSLCSVNPTSFFVADYLTQSDWNLFLKSSGIIGLGPFSPLWNISGQQGQNKSLIVKMLNVTDWTFAGKTVLTQDVLFSQIQINQSHYDPNGNNTILIQLGNSSNYYANTTGFGFGQTVVVNGINQVFYQDINNKNSTIYGQFANQTIIDLNFKGLGLPKTSFDQFVSLINIASNGSASCDSSKYGICILPNSCGNYSNTNLWSYSFNISFQNQFNSLVVPLASFAADSLLENQTVCSIYVEQLDELQDNSKQIIIGSMFFQSFYYQQQNTASGLSFNLYVNPNALVGTYILGSSQTQAGNNPFQVQPKTAPIATNQINGLPTFNYTLLGSKTTTPDSFSIDFNSDVSLVWYQNCKQSLVALNQSCDATPTNVKAVYEPSTTPSQLTVVEIGGYEAEGTTIQQQLCVNDGTECKYINIFVGYNILKDQLLYGQQGSNGILGYGPNSPLWHQFVNTETSSVTYSIALSSIQTTNQLGLKQQSTAQSNVTFGAADQTQYTGAPSVLAVSSNNKYQLSEFGFGIVYYTSGSATSSYFSNLTSTYPAQFNINFQGLGLPSDMFTNFSALLNNITSNTASCTPDQGGVCVLPQSCSSYPTLQDFAFQVQFTSNSSYWFRVPLLTFIQSNSSSNCVLQVQWLDQQTTQGDSVIFGGMFFQQFYGVFVNSYDAQTSALSQQSVQLFPQVNNNQSGITGTYVGNQVLAIGTNPFIQITPTPTPTPDDKTSVVWIIILCVIIVILAGFLAWAIFKWRQTAKQTEDKRKLIYAIEEEKPLNPQTNYSEQL